MNLFDGNSIIYFIVFVLALSVIIKNFKLQDKRMIICTIILSGIFSVFEILGFNINTKKNYQMLMYMYMIIIQKIEQ